jgi:PAS domain S-box-containing protein
LLLSIAMPTFWEAITLLTSKRNRDFQEVAQLIANVFPDPLFVIDLEANRFVWVSPGGISLFGLDVEESLSLPAYEFLKANLTPFEPLATLWSERRAQAEVAFEYNSDGKSYFLEGYWIRLKEDLFALVLRDVTELRHAQEELAKYAEELAQQVQTLTQLKEALQKANETLKAQSEQLRLLAAVAAHTDNTVIITDAEGKIIWVNRGFEKLTGYTLEEVKGKIPGKLLQGPDTDPNAVARIREKLRKKEPFVEEILNYSRDGRPYWVRLYITPLTDELNRVTHFMAIELDVTEDKKRLQQLETQLRDIQEARSYAERIFRRFLPPVEGLREIFRDAQVWNAPLDGVGGDFYFYAPQEGGVLVALGDSTGHGAAAALISVYALTSLWRASRQPIGNLSSLYQELLEGVVLSMGEGTEGFELALLKYDQTTMRLEYLGARRPLWIFRQGQLHQVRGSRSDISSHTASIPALQAVYLQPGDRLYLFSDGVIDQLNPEGKKFSSNRLARFLEVNQYLDLSEQVALLKEAIAQWQGSAPQTDDILFLALEV